MILTRNIYKLFLWHRIILTFLSFRPDLQASFWSLCTTKDFSFPPSCKKNRRAAVQELWIHFSWGYFFDSKRQDESTDNPQYSNELTSDDFGGCDKQ